MQIDMGIYESCKVASRLRGRVEEAGDRNAIRLVHDDSVLRQGADALAVLDEDERHRDEESTARAKNKTVSDAVGGTRRDPGGHTQDRRGAKTLRLFRGCCTSGSRRAGTRHRSCGKGGWQVSDEGLGERREAALTWIG